MSKTPFDLKRIRAETPGSEGRIHLNNAGASMMPAPVVESMIGYMNSEAQFGGYEAAERFSDQVRDLYAAAADVCGARAEQIYFADSGTRAWNAIVNAVPLGAGDVVLTTRAEFGSNAVSLLHRCAVSGAELRIVDCDESGQLDIDDLEAKIGPQVRMVAATHVAAHRGYTAPVSALSAAAESVGAFFLLDGCQSVGQLNISFSDLGCHALVGTSRKWLRGPRGAAFGVVAENLPCALIPAEVDLASADIDLRADEPSSAIDIRDDPRRFELWERGYCAALGFGSALRYFLDIDPTAARDRLAEVAKRLREGVESLGSGPRVYADPTGESAIVGLGFANGEEALSTKKSLVAAGINCSTMADYDAPWDFRALGVDVFLRLAPHYFVSDEQVDQVLEILHRAT